VRRCPASPKNIRDSRRCGQRGLKLGLHRAVALMGSAAVAVAAVAVAHHRAPFAPGQLTLAAGDIARRFERLARRRRPGAARRPQRRSAASIVSPG